MTPSPSSQSMEISRSILFLTCTNWTIRHRTIGRSDGEPGQGVHAANPSAGDETGHFNGYAGLERLGVKLLDGKEQALAALQARAVGEIDWVELEVRFAELQQIGVHEALCREGRRRRVSVERKRKVEQVMRNPACVRSQLRPRRRAL